MTNDTLTPENGVTYNYVDANDTREKLEADVRKVFSYRIEQPIVLGWLDRQAAITEREWMARWTSHAITNAELNADLLEIGNQLIDMENQRDELQAKLDEFEHTHIKLPVDADGVPIKPGDYMALGDSRGEVIALTYTPGNSLPWEMQLDDGEWYSTQFARHVQPYTVESVLEDFVEAFDKWDNECNHDREEQRDKLFADYAERIRKAVEQ